MSERGSFVTAYIYCERCFERALAVLQADHGGWLSEAHAFGGRRIAGRVDHTAPGHEPLVFTERGIDDALAAVLCHPLTIVVAPDCGQPQALVFEPKG